MAQITSSHPQGNPDSPLSPVSLALAYGASFVARGFAGEVEGMMDIIRQGIAHKGFSFLHFVSPCVTFDKSNFTWAALRERSVSIHASHDRQDYRAAVNLAQDERLFTGVFYQDKTRLSYQDQLESSRASG